MSCFLLSCQIPLGLFRSEEVRTWSSLSSPRVLDLFGAVRDGLNVVLFMDLKPGNPTRFINLLFALKLDQPESLNLPSLFGPAPEGDNPAP